MPPSPIIRRHGEAETLQVGAERLSFTLNGGDTGGAFGLVERVVSPLFQSPPQPHSHSREDFMGYLLEGRLVFQLNGREEALGPGDTLFVPRGVWFRWWNPLETPARVLFLYTPGGFEDFFREVAAQAAARAARIHDYDKTLTDITALHDRFGMVRADQPALAT